MSEQANKLPPEYWKALGTYLENIKHLKPADKQTMVDFKVRLDKHMLGIKDKDA